MRSHGFTLSSVFLLVGIVAGSTATGQGYPQPSVAPPIHQPVNQIGFGAQQRGPISNQSVISLAESMQNSARDTAYHKALQERRESSVPEPPTYARTENATTPQNSYDASRNPVNNAMSIQQQYEMLRRSNLARARQQNNNYQMQLVGHTPVANPQPVRYAMNNQAFRQDPFGVSRQNPFADQPAPGLDPFGAPPTGPDSFSDTPQQQQNPFDDFPVTQDQGTFQQQPAKPQVFQNRMIHDPFARPLQAFPASKRFSLQDPQQPAQDRVPPTLPDGSQSVPNLPGNTPNQLPVPKPVEQPNVNQVPQNVLPPPRLPDQETDPGRMPLPVNQLPIPNPAQRPEIVPHPLLDPVTPNQVQQPIRPYQIIEQPRQVQPLPLPYQIIETPGLPPVVRPDQIQSPQNDEMMVAPPYPGAMTNPNVLYDNSMSMEAPALPCQSCEAFEQSCCDPQFYVSIFGGFTEVGQMNRDFDLTQFNLDDGGGVGFAFGQIQGMNLRTETEFCFRGNDVLTFNGNAIDGTLHTYAGMANAYWEFSDFPGLHRIKPYVGAGLGFVFAEPDFQQGAVQLLDDGSSSFAYQWMAGANYNVSCNMDVFLEYRRFIADELDLHAKGAGPGMAAGLYNYETDNVFFGLRLKF